MAVRPIDAVQVLHNINLRRRPTPVSEFESGFNNGLNQAMREITHAPTLTQPNEPLTLEELREMDEEPVYVVSCKKHHCGAYGCAHQTKKNAVAYWNTRAPILSAEEMEMLEGME